MWVPPAKKAFKCHNRWWICGIWNQGPAKCMQEDCNTSTITNTCIQYTYIIMILTENKYSTVLCHWMELSPTVARKGAVRSGRTSYPCFRSHRPIPVETQASKECTFGMAGLKRSPCHVPPKQVTCYCVIITQERGESFQNEQLWNLSLCNRV